MIVHCKSGGRSMQFVQILRQNGFKDAKSMAGGILLWNKDVEGRSFWDSIVPRQRVRCAGQRTWSRTEPLELTDSVDETRLAA